MTKEIIGKKARYIIEEINEIGDYYITIYDHELYEDGQSWMVGNFDYQSSIDRIESDQKIFLAFSIKKVMKKYNMNIKQISDRFDIPYRTVQNWCNGSRECPTYIIKMMDEILSKSSRE